MSFCIENVNEEIMIKSQAIDSNTVALWHFNDSTGSTVTDETSNNYDGTISGASWTTGNFNNALSFNGSNDYVGVGTLANIHKPITIEAWVYPTSISLLQTIFGRNAQISGGYNYENTLFINNTGEVYFLDKETPAGYDLKSTEQLCENQWHYVAVTRDTSNNMKIYINGTEVESGNLGGDRQLAGRVYRIGRVNTGHYPYSGKIDEMRISNIVRTPQEIKDAYVNHSYINPYLKNGTLTSKAINLPAGMKWDTFIFDKTQNTNTELNITILDASNNQPIPGSPKYNNEGEFDISYFDPVTYPSIKLKATITGDGYTTSILHYWGISWNETNTWHDTLFGDIKVESLSNGNTTDGNVEFQNTGNLRSKSINIPDKFYYNTFIVNKTVPSGASLKVTILDASTNSGITGFKDLTSSNIDLSGLDPKSYPSIKLKASYSSSGEIGILHDWSVNWTHNVAPIIKEIASIQIIN